MTNYISIKSIFPTLALDPDQYDTYQILEWATEGYLSLGIQSEYKRSVAVLQVENHKALLPSNLHKIQSVAYMFNKTLTDTDVKSLCDALTEEEKINCGCYSNKTNEVIEPDADPPATIPDNYYAPNQYNITKLKSQGILNNYTLWVSSSFYKNNFTFMRLSNRAWAQQFHSGDCPNLDCINCDYTYSINHNGEIVTEFNEGIICISYLAYPLDDSGLLMILDDPDVKKAISAYASARHWELRWNMKEEGTEKRYQLYLAKAEKLMAKVRGKVGMARMDYSAIKFITDRYKNIINRPVVWNFNPNPILD